MRTRRLAVIAAIWLSAAAPSLLATTMSIQPSTSAVIAGQVFTLSVEISGATDLYGYQFDVGFNPAVLQATSVTEGAFLGTGGSTIFLPGAVDNVGGTITNNADILNGAVSGVNGSGDLVDITFQALAAGSSTVDIFNLIALNSFGQGLTVSASNATVNVSGGIVPTVPEPGTGLLLATGVFGLFTFLKLRFSQSRLFRCRISRVGN
jgi:hypothetical protein